MPVSFLTSEGYQKLQEELEFLRTTKREQIADRLHEAIEGGELLDNAELEAAKNEQAFVEGRIKELEILLERPVLLELWVKVREDWTEDPAFLREMGLGDPFGGQ